MPYWPDDLQKQVRVVLDSSMLPEADYDTALGEWAQGKYADTPDGQNRAIANLSKIVNRMVCEQNHVPMPDLKARAKALAKNYPIGE